MTPSDWITAGIYGVAVLANGFSTFASTRLGPSKITAAKGSRVVDAILIALNTAWAASSFSIGGLAGWITGALMVTVIVICVVDIFILNRYLDRTKGVS